ncbi:hypothetical protein MBRU_09385 [Mycolicibacterium brumae DSM 44177]|nr:hypothetical protein MBRU_09385 [Mycolicibacterium brumae DSM 44177]
MVGIQRIESGERRPDADDLVALAVVLGVSPSTLLMPSGVAAEDVVSASSIEVEAALLWDWLIARRPLPDESGPLLYERAAIRFFDRALPPWESITIEAGVLGSGEPSEFMKRTLLRKFYPDGVPDGDD